MIKSVSYEEENKEPFISILELFYIHLVLKSSRSHNIRCHRVRFFNVNYPSYQLKIIHNESEFEESILLEDKPFIDNGIMIFYHDITLLGILLCDAIPCNL